MVGIKIFECALCKKEVSSNVRGAKRTYGTRKEIRKHLREIHHINRRAGTPQHKGNRTHKEKGSFGEDKIKDERSSVTQNCILYREY